jgi:hypothetical protein
MRVRLTRKLAERVDGVDLSAHSVGDVMDVSPNEAWLLIAEQWAVPDESHAAAESAADEGMRGRRDGRRKRPRNE